MAVVVAKTIFGGGPYSTTHSRQLRMVGGGERRLTEITIKRAKGGFRDQRGVFRASITPPFMPEKPSDPYHPGANSVCFAIQTAHLMGCNPIYLLGFTLQSGTGYHFGLQNPILKTRSFYVAEIPLNWLKWYESCYPGRVKLWPGWSGPIYEVFDEAEVGLPNGARDEPDADGADGVEVE